MDTPQFTDDQFVNGALLTSAMTELQGNFSTIGSTLHTAGLLDPSALVFTPTNLVLQIQAPSSFAVLFGNGLVVGAHGTANGADSSTYSLNLASLVPGSGSQTVFILAQYTTIGEAQTLVIGPPQGHPDFDPNFAPFEFFNVLRDSINVIASTTAADNSTTFELARITLNAGATLITSAQIVKSNQVFASAVLNPTGVVAGTYAGATVTVGVDGRISGIAAVGYGILNANNTWTGGTNTFTGAIQVNGAATIEGITFFGTSGEFFMAPNFNGGTTSQLLSFAASQFLEFVPGTGFIWNTTGQISVVAGSTIGLIAPAGVNISAALTTGGPIVAEGATSDISAGRRLLAAVGALGSGDLNAAAILADFPFSAAGDGYTELPNGIIIQWGVGANITVPQTIGFNIPFPNACFSVICEEGAPAGWGGTSPTVMGAQSPSTTSFDLYVLKWNGAAWANSGGIAFRWIAIGF